MKFKTSLSAFFALSLLAALPAQAEALTDRWYAGISGDVFLPGGGNSLKRAGGVSALVGYEVSDSWNVEALVMSIPNAASSHGGNSALNGFALQGAWHFWGYERVDPFFTFGVQSLFSSDHVFADDSRRSAIGPTLGFGLAYHLTDNLSLRADARSMVSIDSPSGIAFSISGGLQWSFGGGGNQSDEKLDTVDLKKTFVITNDAQIDEVVSYVKSVKKCELLVRGHIDCVLGMGKTRAKNMSMDAAQKAKSQLVAKGIDESIIELEGVGFSEPVKPFNFSTGVPENNRVEIKILGVDE